MEKAILPPQKPRRVSITTAGLDLQEVIKIQAVASTNTKRNIHASFSKYSQQLQTPIYQQEWISDHFSLAEVAGAGVMYPPWWSPAVLSEV